MKSQTVNNSFPIIAVSIFTPFSSQAKAHLRNDVFDKAKDDPTVKTDISDGQLRISTLEIQGGFQCSSPAGIRGSSF